VFWTSGYRHMEGWNYHVLFVLAVVVVIGERGFSWDSADVRYSNSLMEVDRIV